MTTSEAAPGFLRVQLLSHAGVLELAIGRVEAGESNPRKISIGNASVEADRPGAALDAVRRLGYA
jgi:hypothetical protein